MQGSPELRLEEATQAPSLETALEKLSLVQRGFLSFHPHAPCSQTPSLSLPGAGGLYRGPRGTSPPVIFLP